ncbi:MAG: hypothetical protein ACLR8Y_01205 [Alistipes indistinctus]
MQLLGADFTSRIDLLKGEKWWGVFIAGGRPMPFDAPFQKIDLSQGRGQKTPFMVSNRGRYVWSAEPFSITYTGDSFLIESPSGRSKPFRPAGRCARPTWFAAIRISARGNAPSRN